MGLFNLRIGASFRMSNNNVFLKAGESLPAAISLKDESGNEIENISTDDIQVFQQNTSKGGIYYDDQGVTPIIEYKDMVADSNNIQFKKTGQDNTGLAGSIFTLTKQDGVVNNSSNWKATSNATGEVQFTEVDAGKDADHKLAYTMTETVTADKYHDQGASFTVYTWMESGQFRYTIESKNTSLATVSTTDDSYTIKNVYRQGKITFKKVDSVTENGISNVKFDIYNAGTSNKINTTSAVSNSSGVVTFDNIPYNAAGYDIKESE